MDVSGERTANHRTNMKIDELERETINLLKENLLLRMLLEESERLLVGHHDSTLCTFTGDCPVCSRNHTEDYPNNIFGRIETALSSR